MKYSLKHMAEYALLRSIAGTANILPYRAALAFGATAAWTAHCIFRFRAKEARRRIKTVFKDKYSDNEIARIAWISWRNIVFNMIEMLRIGKMDEEWVAAHYEADEFLHNVRMQIDTGKGCIIACPHMGNWDLAAVPCCQKRLPVFSIAAQQRNPLVNSYFNDLRNTPGLETITRGGSTMKRVIDYLENGKILVILPDSRMKTKDIEVDFMGSKANLGKGMAFFARKTNLPIHLCICTRTGWTKHGIKFLPVVKPDQTLDKKEDIDRITRHVISLIDKEIHDQPEQWFWYNKRWVLDPVEDSPDRGTENTEDN